MRRPSEGMSRPTVPPGPVRVEVTTTITRSGPSLVRRLSRSRGCCHSRSDGMQVAAPLQRRMRAPDLVDCVRNGASDLPSRAPRARTTPIARAYWYFSESRYSSLPRPQRNVLEQLVAGVDAPGRRQHRREHGANLERRRARRTAGTRAGCRVLTKKVRAHHRGGFAGSSRRYSSAPTCRCAR